MCVQSLPILPSESVACLNTWGTAIHTSGHDLWRIRANLVSIVTGLMRVEMVFGKGWFGYVFARQWLSWPQHLPRLSLLSFVLYSSKYTQNSDMIHDILQGRESESNEASVEERSRLHQLWRLPMDRPLLRRGNAIDWNEPITTSTTFLQNVHVGLPAPSKAAAGKIHTIWGSYTYHHYMQVYLEYFAHSRPALCSGHSGGFNIERLNCTALRCRHGVDSVTRSWLMATFARGAASYPPCESYHLAGSFHLLHCSSCERH